MPNIKRPNAPERLPSHLIERSFFRLKPGGGVDFSASPEYVSPSTPSLISPTTLSPKSISRQDRRRLQSEGSPSPRSALAREGASTTTAFELIAPAAALEVPPSSDRHESFESLQSEPVSTRSSLSSKARKLFTRPTLRVSSNATKDGLPPREAKKGFTWHHQKSGHWLEIRIGRRQHSDGRSPSAPEGFAPKSPETKSPDMITERVSYLDVPKKAPMKTTFAPTPVKIYPPVYPTSLTSPREGIYGRTRRKLGLKREAFDSSASSVASVRTKTGDLLDRTTSMLRLVAMKQRTPPSTSSSSSALTTVSNAGMKMQPLRPTRSIGQESSSSSIRSLLMGKPPHSTPEARDMYTGSDNKQYVQIEMTNPGAPTFLPSEARRINTPPLHIKKVRGFFFDHAALMDAERFPERKRASMASDDYQALVSAKQRRVSDTEWYRVKLDEIESADVSREQFVSEVPDHLPNSPLCPRHPKHGSAGTGVCPMHGRNKASTSTGERSTPLASPDSYGEGVHHIVY